MPNLAKYMLVVLLCGLSIGAFSQTEKKPISASMRTSLFLNAAVSNYKQPALGFTIARTGAFGYYANFMIGLSNLHFGYDAHVDADYRLTDGADAGLIPFYTGRRAYNRLSATVGAMARMKIPLFLYVGAGYGYKTETVELLNRKWAQTAASLGHSAVVEGGLVGQVDNVTLMAGYSLFIGQDKHLYHEAKVGLGYIFKK